jgi:hypothetical protein
MAVNARQLSKSGARGKDLDAVVREQLHIIDDKLLKANRAWGRNVVTHDLPVSLPIPGLDKKDAQRILYSSVLRSLEKRGFETRILLEPERTTLFIAWTTDLGAGEVEAMNELISGRRLRREELEEFTGAAKGARSHRASAPRR